MLIIIAHWTVKPEMLDDYMHDMRMNVEYAKSEEGGLYYQPAVEDAASGKVLVVERWRDQATFDAHRTAPHILKAREKWGPHLSGHLEIFEAADSPA